MFLSRSVSSLKYYGKKYRNRSCWKPNQQKNPFKEKNKAQDLSQEKLNQKIQKLKTEIEELKVNQNVNSSEKQIELQKKKEELAKLEKLTKDNNTTQKPKSDNNFPIGWVAGSGIVLLMGLVAVLIVRNRRKKKAQSKK